MIEGIPKPTASAKASFNAKYCPSIFLLKDIA